MAIAGVADRFLDQGSSFRYEPIEKRGGCGVVGRRRRPRNVLVACALVCAVIAAAGFAASGRRSDRLLSSSAPPSEEEQPPAADLSRPTVLASTAGAKRATHPSPSLATVERGSLQVRVANHYQVGENATTDLSLYPWEHVAEPYRETRMELTRVPHGVEDGANIM